MLKSISKISTALVVSSLSVYFPNFSNQESYENDDISVYEQHVEQFNLTHNTDYLLSPNEEKHEIIMKMSLDEFDAYLNAVANGSYFDVELPCIEYDIKFDGCIVEKKSINIPNIEDKPVTLNECFR